MNKIQTQKRGSINCREISMNHLRTRKGGSSSFFWRSDLENKHHKLCNVIAKYNSILKRLLGSNPQQCFFKDKEKEKIYYPVFVILLSDDPNKKELEKSIKKSEKIDLNLIQTIEDEYITLIPIDKIKTMKTDAINALTENQIPWFTENQIQAFTENQIQAFTGDQISWFTENQISWFTENQISWFTEIQIKAFAEAQSKIIFAKRRKPSGVPNTNTITNNNTNMPLTLKKIDKYRLERVYRQLDTLIDSYNTLVDEYNNDKKIEKKKNYYKIVKYDNQPMTFITNRKVTSRKLLLAMGVSIVLASIAIGVLIAGGAPPSLTGLSWLNYNNALKQNTQYSSCDFHTYINNELS
jgi:hypothetical protein